MVDTNRPAIVFFGSGPVAAESLRLLAQSFEIEAVITKPRAEHHRGSVPVIELATELGLAILTASNRADLDAVIRTSHLQSKLAILIDFGIIVSQQVIDFFPLGIVNSHFSLLPEWRGADPITFAILSGQERTGISLMMLVQGMDEGPLIAQAAYDIPDDYTTPQLTQDLIELSHESLQHIIPLYLSGHITPAPQETATITGSATPTYSRKLSKADGDIDWNKSAQQIEREIRAYIEWPKSRCQIAGKDVVLTKAHVVTAHGTPGTTELRGKELIMYSGQDALSIDLLKPSGKNEMTAEAFIAGHKNQLSA